MATTQETFQLIWEQKGEGAIDEANQKLRDTETELKNLKLVYGLGSVAEDDYAKATERLAGQKKKLKEELAAYNQLAKAGNKSTRDLGGGFLELSRGIEDAQYGLNGVLNNLPGMIQRFGGTAGLAAGVSLTAVAINQLLPTLKKLAEDMGGVDATAALLKGTMGQLDERVKALQEMKIRLPVDQLELDNALAKLEKLKEAEAAWKASMESRSKVEKESGQAVTDTLAELPGGEAAAVTAMAAKKRNRALEQSVERREAEAEQKDAEAQAAAHKQRAESLRAAGAHDEATESDRRENEQLARAKTAAQRESAARQRVIKDTNDSIGEALAGAKKGDQRQLQVLGQMFFDTGHPDVGGKLAEQSAARIKTKAQKKAEAEAAKEAEKTRKDVEAATAAAAKHQAAEAKKKADEEHRTAMAVEAATAAAAKRQTAERQKGAALQAERARHENAPALQAETAFIGRGGYADEAGALMARTKAMGGAPDQFGRFHKMDERQMFAYVQHEVQKALAERNRGMGGKVNPARDELATRITSMGQDTVNRQILANGGMQNVNQGKLIEISGELLGNARQQQATIANHGGAIQHLFREVEDLKRDTRTTRPGGLPRR